MQAMQMAVFMLLPSIFFRGFMLPCNTVPAATR